MLPTNSLPLSTYVKSVLDAFDTRTLNDRIIWLVPLRDCTATPAMVCTAPESMVIHSPALCLPAIQAPFDSSALIAQPVPGCALP